MLSHLDGDLHAVVVHVRHKRNHAALGTQGGPDLPHGTGMGHGWGSHPNNFRTGISQAADSSHRSLDIQRVFVDHRLNHHGVVTAHRHVADHDGPGGASINLGVVPTVRTRRD